MKGKLIAFFKKRIIGNQRIFNLLHNTYYLKVYKSTVLNHILPQLEKIGLTQMQDNQNERVKIFVPYIETSFGKIFILIFILKALQIRGARILFLKCNRGIPICEKFSIRSSKGGCKYCDFINIRILPKLGFDVIEINDYIGDKYTII